MGWIVRWTILHNNNHIFSWKNSVILWYRYPVLNTVYSLYLTLCNLQMETPNPMHEYLLFGSVDLLLFLNFCPFSFLIRIHLLFCIICYIHSLKFHCVIIQLFQKYVANLDKISQYVSSFYFSFWILSFGLNIICYLSLMQRFWGTNILSVINSTVLWMWNLQKNIK